MIELIKQAIELQQIGTTGLLFIIIAVLIRVIKNQTLLCKQCEKEKDELHDTHSLKIAECNRKLLKLARGKEIDE